MLRNSWPCSNYLFSLFMHGLKPCRCLCLVASLQRVFLHFYSCFSLYMYCSLLLVNSIYSSQLSRPPLNPVQFSSCVIVHPVTICKLLYNFLRCVICTYLPSCCVIFVSLFILYINVLIVPFLLVSPCFGTCAK